MPDFHSKSPDHKPWNQALQSTSPPRDYDQCSDLRPTDPDKQGDPRTAQHRKVDSPKMRDISDRKRWKWGHCDHEMILLQLNVLYVAEIHLPCFHHCLLTFAFNWITSRERGPVSAVPASPN